MTSYSRGAAGAWWSAASTAFPHLFASFVDGYRGLRRGGRRAVLEYDLASLGAGTLSFFGGKARPLLAPLALRSEPLPTTARVALGGLLAAATALVAGLVRRRG